MSAADTDVVQLWFGGIGHTGGLQHGMYYSIDNIEMMSYRKLRSSVPVLICAHATFYITSLLLFYV